MALSQGLDLRPTEYFWVVRMSRKWGQGQAFEIPGGWVGGPHLPGTQWGRRWGSPSQVVLSSWDPMCACLRWRRWVAWTFPENWACLVPDSARGPAEPYPQDGACEVGFPQRQAQGLFLLCGSLGGVSSALCLRTARYEKGS